MQAWVAEQFEIVNTKLAERDAKLAERDTELHATKLKQKRSCLRSRICAACALVSQAKLSTRCMRTCLMKPQVLDLPRFNGAFEARETPAVHNVTITSKAGLSTGLGGGQVSAPSIAHKGTCPRPGPVGNPSKSQRSFSTSRF